MKRFVAVLCALLLSACASLSGGEVNFARPFDPAAFNKRPGANSVVFLGLDSRNKDNEGGVLTGYHSTYVISRIDEATRTFKPMAFQSFLRCSDKRAPDSNCVNGTTYVAFIMPPGTYVLQQVIHDASILHGFVKAKFVDIKRSRGHLEQATFSEDATALPEAPQFTVKANEVVYVGDIVLDFTAPDALTTYGTVSEANIRTMIRPTGLEGKMIVRPWTRPSGANAKVTMWRKFPT